MRLSALSCPDSACGPSLNTVPRARGFRPILTSTGWAPVITYTGCAPTLGNALRPVRADPARVHALGRCENPAHTKPGLSIDLPPAEQAPAHDALPPRGLDHNQG